MHTCHRAGDDFHLTVPTELGAPEEDTATLILAQGSTVTHRVCLTFTTEARPGLELPVYVRATGPTLVTVPDAATMVRPHADAPRARHLAAALDAELNCPCLPPALASAALHAHRHLTARAASRRIEVRGSEIGVIRLLAASHHLSDLALTTALGAPSRGYTGDLEHLVLAADAAST